MVARISRFTDPSALCPGDTHPPCEMFPWPGSPSLPRNLQHIMSIVWVAFGQTNLKRAPSEDTLTRLTRRSCWFGTLKSRHVAQKHGALSSFLFGLTHRANNSHTLTYCVSSSKHLAFGALEPLQPKQIGGPKPQKTPPSPKGNQWLSDPWHSTGNQKKPLRLHSLSEARPWNSQPRPAAAFTSAYSSGLSAS